MSPLSRALLPHPLFSACRHSLRASSRTLSSTSTSTSTTTAQSPPSTSTPTSQPSQSPPPSSQSPSSDLPKSLAFEPATRISSFSSSQSSSSIPISTSTPVFEALTYHVHRTHSSQLPIYHLAKRGGSLQQTKIRKISGSSADLRRDLVQGLGLEEKSIAVNQINGDVVLKGWKKHEVARFLEEKYF